MPRISQLPALTVPEANDEIAIVDASAATTKKITRADFLKGAALPTDTVDTQAIEDGAVTADKIDWATLLKLSGSLTATISSITTTPQALGTITIPAGYSNVAVDIDGIFEINHNNTAATDYTCQIEKNSATLQLGVVSASTGQYFISKTVQVSTTVSTGDTIRFLIARGGGSGGIYNSGRSTYRISQ